MNKPEISTRRLSKRVPKGMRVSLCSVKDRLVERVEHHALDFEVEVNARKFQLHVAFFDVDKPALRAEHDRSAVLNMSFTGKLTPTPEEYDAIKLFVARHLKLAQAVKVYDPHPHNENENTEACSALKPRKVFSDSSSLKSKNPSETQ